MLLSSSDVNKTTKLKTKIKTKTTVGKTKTKTMAYKTYIETQIITPARIITRWQTGNYTQKILSIPSMH